MDNVMEIPYLNLGKINDREDIRMAVRRASESGWYLLGEEVKAFEREYADYIGTSESVACANGLDALWLILRAYIELGRLKPGDEVIVPANTYIASILAITGCGLVPVLVEPDPDTLQIDPENIEAAITPRTRALMIVHLYGICAYNEKIRQICDNCNPRLILIEDNAQAHGCHYCPEPGVDLHTGSLGDAAGHSFYPGKNLGALGDAGAVTTSDPQLAATVRAIANYGSSRKYVFDFEGRNSRMDEIQAAVLRAKLKTLDADNDVRRRYAAMYRDGISNPSVTVPKAVGWGTEDAGTLGNVYHIFPVLSPRRDELQRYLADHGVQTQIHYPIPPYRQRCYAGKGVLRLLDSTAITDRIHAEELSLPLNQAMTPEEITRIITLINNF